MSFLSMGGGIIKEPRGNRVSYISRCRWSLRRIRYGECSTRTTHGSWRGHGSYSNRLVTTQDTTVGIGAQALSSQGRVWTEKGTSLLCLTNGPTLMNCHDSVVHRTLHLLTTTPNTTLAESYTTARREFYDRRHQEDITRRVAAEEATHTGAVYPDRTNPILAGMAHEDRQHEEWRAWAVRERELRNQGRQRVGGAFGGRRRGGEEDEVVEEVNEGDDEESRRQLDALDEAPVATEGVQMAQAQRTAFSGGRV